MEGNFENSTTDGQRSKVNTKDEAEIARKEAADITFGVDLVEGAYAHLEFLRSVDDYPCLFGGPYLKRAIQRYETLWLPLATEHNQEFLAAPLDIEWVWHCHLLAPHFYRDDCKTVYGTLIGHRLFRTQERNKALRHTQILWEERYPSEPFEVNLPKGCYFEDVSNDFQSKLSYNIEEAALRQGTFYYNVSLPHFWDKKFLNLCILRYKKFLYLKINTKDAFLVPCYDNDLIWHTHQLYPKIYYQDTCRLLGHLYNHDDSTTDRSPGSKLSLAFAETIALWKNMFCENYSLPGAMYRGPSPKGSFSKSKPRQMKINQNEIKLCFDLVTLDRIPERSKFTVKVFLEPVLNNDEKKCIFTLKGPSVVWDGIEIEDVLFDTTKYANIVFKVLKRKGLIYSKDETLCEGDIDVKSLLNAAHPDFGGVFQVHIELKGAECMTVCCSGRITFTGEPYSLYLKQGTYLRCKRPQKLEDVFRIEKIDDTESISPNCRCGECEIAGHEFLNGSSQAVLQSRVLHNAAHNFSAVQVIRDGHVVAIATLIDSSHLPLPSQVTAGFPAVTLSPIEGERAFLVKDNDGDWAVVVGKWIDSDKTVGLHIFVHKCRSGFQQKLFTRYQLADEAVRINQCQIDLRKGSVTFDTETEDIPQHISLTIVIGLLHVLCMPRPTAWQPGSSVDTEATKRLRCNKLPFVVASGLNIQTPSNHYRSLRK